LLPHPRRSAAAAPRWSRRSRRPAKIDEPALRALVGWQLAEGVHFVVPCGSTGEAATLTPEEHRRVVEVGRRRGRRRGPVGRGAGSNDTGARLVQPRDGGGRRDPPACTCRPRTASRRSAASRRTSARRRRDRAPGRAVQRAGPHASNVEAATTLRLAEVPNIVAVKEASGNLAQVDAILRDRPDGFAVLSGDDQLTLGMLAAGADGVISVVSNATPRLMAELCDRAAAGDSPARARCTGGWCRG
jgi:4-hydroxy-tetrahydrodipicolinate synthase